MGPFSKYAPMFIKRLQISYLYIVTNLETVFNNLIKENKMRYLTILFALFALGSVAVSANEINQSFLRGIAIEGYDPVAYFTTNQPMKGDSDYSHEWKDATWHFSNSANRDLFIKNPEKYSPQFGGHCANGLSEGHKVSGNPLIWRIIDGKLYFFYSERGRERWETNTEQWIKDAWRNWEKLKYQ